jgi:hypothetical protein
MDPFSNKFGDEKAQPLIAHERIIASLEEILTLNDDDLREIVIRTGQLWNEQLKSNMDDYLAGLMFFARQAQYYMRVNTRPLDLKEAINVCLDHQYAARN